MKERRGYQNELLKRNSDILPFNDKEAVKDVVRIIKDSMHQIGNRKGKIIYPYQLSEVEQKVILRRLGFQLGKRTTFEHIRLEEGVGTEILIAKKQRKI